MKNIFTFIIAFTLMISNYEAKSSHLMGGQITATYLSADTNGVHYLVELTAYRDTIGIPMQATAEFDIHKLDTSGNWNFVFSQTVAYDTTSGGLMTSVNAYGVEVYLFQDTITFVDTSGYFSISYEECCRNAAIANMSNPGNESMALTTYLTIDNHNQNSTPTFITPPVAYLPSDTIWQYNPLPFDPDGDSLSWSMTVPLDGNGTVSGYEFLSDSLYSNLSGIFSLDSITGSLSWNARMSGNFVASFIIEEYRSGQKIGESSRDMQFIVVNDTTNYIPQISNMQSIPTNSGGYPYVILTAGQNYQLHLIGNDANPNDVLSMNAYGEAFNLNLSAPTFTYSLTGNGNEIQGDFSWTPDASHVRSTPYITVFRTSDNVFNHDETIQFEVASMTSSENLNQYTSNNIYPNPATNNFIIPLSLENNNKVSINIYNILGSKVSETKKMHLSSGNHLIMKNIDFKKGQYFVVVENELGEIITSQKLTVTN